MIGIFPVKLIYVDKYEHIRLTDFTRNEFNCKFYHGISGYKMLFLQE